MNRNHVRLLPIFIFLSSIDAFPLDAAITVTQTYHGRGAADQDDVCLWKHPTNASLSTVIGSDKGNGYVYVYDLDGNMLQRFFTGKPGNIDVRYDNRLGTQRVDIVAFNERKEQSIRVYKVNPKTRKLDRIDDGNIITGPNDEGFTLYKHDDNSLYGIAGHGVLKKYLLFDNGKGQISGRPTAWEFHENYPEGMVGDDETGYIYFADPRGAIWKVSALDHTDKKRIAQIGDGSGIGADVEGITIYYAANGNGYIIASSQNDSKFIVLKRKSPHEPVGQFTIPGVKRTDGIDVLNMNLNHRFSQGVFIFHNGQASEMIHAVKWEDIATEVGGLIVDTRYVDRRFMNRYTGKGNE